MKRKNLILLISVVLTVSIFTSCSNSKPVKPDTPANASLMLKTAINSDNYDSFNALFSDTRKNAVSKEMFSQFNQLSTAGSGIYLYGLITYTNGEMLLVRYTPEKVNGEYKIEDVVKVPDDMKKLFQVK